MLLMEDFCQISERLTEDKYKGSVERIGKLLRTHSIFPGLDINDLFERVLCNFILGNSDMHLKNYSLIETPQGMRLSPAYDLLSTIIAIPEDPEESALTINGKKSKLTMADFDSLAQHFGLQHTVSVKLYKKFIKAKGDIFKRVENGLLPADLKERLIGIVEKRIGMFHIDDIE